MANQLTTPEPIRVSKGVIYVKSSAVTVVTTNTILGLFTAATDIMCRVKDLTITPPTGEVGKIDLIGETASAYNPTSTFQNYLLEEKSWTLAKCSGTLLLNVGDEDPFDAMISGSGTAGTSSARISRSGNMVPVLPQKSE